MDQLLQFVDWKVMLVQVINFAIIFYVLKRFVFRPLISYLDEQEKKQSQAEALVRESEKQRADAEKEAKRILDEARKEAASIKAQTESLAKKEASSLVTAAQEEIVEMKAKAELDLANERTQMENAMKERILSVAIKLNEKLFGEKKEANVEFIKHSFETN